VELTANDWIRLGQTLVMIASMALSVYLFLKARSTKATDELKTGLIGFSAKLDGNDARMRQELQILVARDSDMDKRLSVLETRVSHMPTHGDLQGIKNELSGLKSAVAAVDERSENILDMVQTIQKHLLEN
jgi:hypothetical protein